MRGPAEIIVGVVYDPHRIPGAKLDELFDRKLEAVWDAALRQRNLTMTGAGARFDPWEAVAQMEADRPGDILPHPGLRLPRHLQYPRWYPTEGELTRIRGEAMSRQKAEHVLATGDWAVDGEGS